MEKILHTVHESVLLSEVLAALNLKPGMTVVDATLGGGGYTEALLKRVLPGGRVIAFDWDSQAHARFLEYAHRVPLLQDSLQNESLILVEESFSQLERELRTRSIISVDALVADLGLSSDQLADPLYGLSFLTDGPLDMRLNSKEKVKAADLIREWSEERLTELFEIYGDEPEAKRVAKAVVSERAKQPIERTTELAAIVKRSVSKRRAWGKIHPATQVFQALRIAVNGEQHALEVFLPQTLRCLKSGGRIAIVSFHSGEDRIVKHFFQSQSKKNLEVPVIVLITKKPIEATSEEVHQNPRARSAKLRVAEKC